MEFMETLFSQALVTPDIITGATFILLRLAIIEGYMLKLILEQVDIVVSGFKLKLSLIALVPQLTES